MSGETLVECKTCKTLEVGTFKMGRVENPNCSKCESEFKLFHGRCPKCRSRKLEFTDLNLGKEVWMDLKID